MIALSYEDAAFVNLPVQNHELGMARRVVKQSAATQFILITPPHFCPSMHADATCAAVMTDSHLCMLRLKGFGQIAP